VSRRSGVHAGVGAAADAVGGAAQSLARYRRYLRLERVLTVESARVYVTAIRPFVERFAVGDRVDLAGVTAADVSAFVLAEAQRRQGTSVCSVVTALRSLLRFLHLEGLIERSLTDAVPGVGAWRGFRDRLNAVSWSGCWPGAIGGPGVVAAISRSCY